MSHWLNKYFLKLSSVKTGLSLLVLLVIFSFTFSLFPVEVEGFSKFVLLITLIGDIRYGAAISFQEQFESPVFIALVIVLSLSLIASIFFRLKSEVLRAKHRRLLHPLFNSGCSQCGHNTVHIVFKALRQYGYKPSVKSLEEQTTVVAERGTKGTFGSILFHMALLVIIAGAAISSVASFRGSISLTEGQEFDSRRNSYGYEQRGKFYGTPQEHLRFRLVRVEPEYTVNGATTVAAIVSGTSEDQHQEIPVYINHRIVRASREIHQGPKTGFSPAIRIARQNGDVLFEGFLRLASIHTKGNPLHRDLLTFPADDLQIEFEFLPDAVFRNDRFASKSDNLLNPLLHVTVTQGLSKSADQWIPVGAATQAGLLTVSFLDVRRWTQFDVVDDPGKNIMLLGVILGSIGLALRILCVRKQVTVLLGFQNARTEIDVRGTTEKFPREFESEMASLRTTLQLLLLEETWTTQSNPPRIDIHKSEKVLERACL